MFCSNCGSKLADGAKFCSECGARVESSQTREFDTFRFEEPVAPETVTEEATVAEEALRDRVSFDWSNVIDEPQKKEVPQGIKSPWAATTGNIDERKIYEEMTPSSDKNRTMSFIDVLKADKEERERAAVDRSIEYTEVLEYDPELLGGTRPPKMHVPPLFEDVDEPVKTPFDDEVEAQESAYVPAAEEVKEPVAENEPVQAVPEARTETVPKEPAVSASRFELPDFLKKAVGFAGGREEEIEPVPERATTEVPSVEELVEEEPAAVEETAAPQVDVPFIEEVVPEEPSAVIEEPVVPIVEEPIAPAVEEPAVPVVEEAEPQSAIPFIEEVVSEETEAIVEESPAEEISDAEDLYFGMDESRTFPGRVSRVDAHAYEYEEDEEDEEVEPIDETALFEEIGPRSQAAYSSSGMTIAAPADKASEIEELKRKLAELTGTLEIDPALMAQAEPAAEAPAETEPEVSRATFVPEVTEADDALFASLTPASEAAKEETEDPEPAASLEDEYLSVPEEAAHAVPEVEKHAKAAHAAPEAEDLEEVEPEAETGTFEALGDGFTFGEEPETPQFTFEPEVTESDEELFAGLAAASEAGKHEITAEDLTAAAEPTPVVEEVTAPAVEEVAAPVVEETAAPAVPFAEEVTTPAVEEEPVIEAPTFTEPEPISSLEDEYLAVPEEAAHAAPKAEEPAAPTVEEVTVPVIEEVAAPVAEEVVIPAAPIVEVPKVEEPAAPVVEEVAAPAAPAVEVPAFEEPEVPTFGLVPEESPTANKGLEPAFDGAASVEPAVIDLTDLLESPEEKAAKEAAANAKETDAMSLDDLFGKTEEPVAKVETKKIDKFYTLYRKNEEFQRLLDEEYSRIKGDNIEIPEEPPIESVSKAPAEAVGTEAAAAAAVADTVKAEETAGNAVEKALSAETAKIDEKPIEDMTIYQDRPAELTDVPEKTEIKSDSGFSVDTADDGAKSKKEKKKEKKEKKEKKGLFGKSKKADKEEAGKSYGLEAEAASDAAEGLGTAAVAGAGAAGAAAVAGELAKDKASGAAEKTSKAPEVDYENVDSGSTILTILAVIVAILLVLLLAVILILHIAPDSSIALTIDQFIENITGGMRATGMFGGQKLL